MIELRPYQSELITATRLHFRAQRKRVLVQLGTGGGKTALASRMLHGAMDRGKRIWFNVHRRELLGQVARAFDLEGLKYGVVAADQDMNVRAQAQICSIPTLGKRLERLPDPDLIVWDECHHCAASTWDAIAKRYPDAYHIGLSATPARLDQRGLAEYFDAMVCGPSVAWLIAQGFLAKYLMFSPPPPDLSSLHKRMGDYVTAETVALMNRPKITGSAIDHYRKHCDGRRAIAFCCSIEHSQGVAEAFKAAGIPAMHVDGKTDDRVRDEAVRDLATGQLKVLTNVDLFGEGVDVPALDAIIDLAPTMSLTKVMQRWGRALRPSPGKEHAVILDHVDHRTMHGLPDDERTWELTTGVTKQAKPVIAAPRLCTMCFAVSRAGAERCKVCGEPFPVEGRHVDQVEGELEQVTAEQLQRRAERQHQGMTKSLEALIQLGRMRGYKAPERWAQHVHAAREAKRRRA